MEEVRVETGVDDLIQLLKKKGKISLKDVATELKIDESYIQAWTDFLIEENIVGVEYKFTKPYIFLNDATSAQALQTKSEESETKGLKFFKDTYFTHAREKKIPESKIEVLWKKSLSEALDKRKDFFLREVAKRNLNNPEGLLLQYKAMLESV